MIMNSQNMDNNIRRNKAPEQTPVTQRNPFHSLENMQTIDSVMQDPQARKKFVMQGSGKPFSIDISSAKQHMLQAMHQNSNMQRKVNGKLPSFESNNNMRQNSQFRVYSPPKLMQQKPISRQPRTMAGSPNKFKPNNMKQNGGYSRAGNPHENQNRMPVSRPNEFMQNKRQNNNNPNRNNQNIRQNPAMLQGTMTPSNFAHPDIYNIPSKNGKKRGPSRPPIIREGDWLCAENNCANINWAKRTGCHLCGAKRPHVEAIKKRPYMLTKLYEANTWSCPRCKNIIKCEHNYCCICGESRTQEIVDGIRAVQRTVAYDRDGKTGNTTKVCASRAEPIDPQEQMQMDELIQNIENDQGQFLDGIEHTQERLIDPETREEPDTEYLLENNVRRNFGNNDYNTSSAKWMMNSAMSHRPY